MELVQEGATLVTRGGGGAPGMPWGLEAVFRGSTIAFLDSPQALQLPAARKVDRQEKGVPKIFPSTPHQVEIDG